MKRKMIGAVMLAALLAGCGAGNGSEAGGDSAAETESTLQVTEEQAADTENTKAESGEPVELEFLFGDPNRTEIFSRIVDDFNNSQQEVHVTFNATGTNHLEELMTRLATNDVPDITSQLQGYELASYVEAGYIKDISEEPYMSYVRSSELDTVTVDGGVYGIPMDT